MTKVAVLQCPKCGKKQEVSLKDIQNNVQFHGHWWSCSNNCKWTDNEYLKRHGQNDTHVYLELVDIFDDHAYFIVYDEIGGYSEYDSEIDAKKDYNARIDADYGIDLESLWWGRCHHRSKYLLTGEVWMPQKEEIKSSDDKLSQEDRL